MQGIHIHFEASTEEGEGIGIFLQRSWFLQAMLVYSSPENEDSEQYFSAPDDKQLGLPLSKR
jgi:hypothetical protein